jgi:hypothetical protein
VITALIFPALPCRLYYNRSLDEEQLFFPEGKKRKKEEEDEFYNQHIINDPLRSLSIKVGVY